MLSVQGYGSNVLLSGESRGVRQANQKGLRSKKRTVECAYIDVISVAGLPSRPGIVPLSWVGVMEEYAYVGGEAGMMG